jgi:hypothetical protein
MYVLFMLILNDIETMLFLERASSLNLRQEQFGATARWASFLGLLR